MDELGHDRLVRRLATMLVKLNQGESLSPRDLASEFGVNLRTVQRDLNVRFSYLPLERIAGRYRLDPVFLGKLSTKDVEKFAGLAGVNGLFPSLSEEFLRDIFDARMQSALLVKGHHYEDLSGKEDTFKKLECATLAKRKVSFRYRRDLGVKLYAAVEPYKLVNNKGIWYLAAKDLDKLKTFTFSRIESLLVTDFAFTHDQAVEKTLLEQESIWFSETKTEVLLQISPEVAGYFKRRSLIANQVIVEEQTNGALVVKTLVGHSNQILPIVRYWLPHIRIISPKNIRAEFENGLRAYLETCTTTKFR